jgi:uncharacterized protein (TIGR00296 family)
VLSIHQGQKAVRYARSVIENRVEGKRLENLPRIGLDMMAGAFVTIKTYPSDELRGCIGIPEPVMTLENALLEAATSVIHDPRFPPLLAPELPNIIVEVTVLTPPKIIKVKNPREYPQFVKVGKDGLIVEKNNYKGLLLPQVPLEWKWDTKEFLSHTCLKAGLQPDAWLDQNIKIYKFQGEIFSEQKPYEEIIKKNYAMME